MHERTSRAAARLLFVLCCALPTVITMSTIMASRTPWYHQRCLRSLESELNANTGLSFTIEDFAQKTPHRLELSNVEVRHPETDQKILSMQAVTWLAHAEEDVLHIHRSSLSADQFQTTWRRLHDRFLCVPQRTSRKLTLLVENLVVQSHTDTMDFNRVEAHVIPKQHRVEVDVTATPQTAAGIPAGGRIQITATRDRTGEIPVTNWSLSTSKTSLPCRVLARSIPALNQLGAAALFHGVVSCEVSAIDQRVDLSGANFELVDLSTWTQDWQTQRMGGVASIHFDRCQTFPDGRRHVVANVQCRNGYLSRTMLESMREHLGVDIASIQSDQRRVPFDLMSFRFSLMGGQLEIAGQCGEDVHWPGLPRNVMICRDGQSLAISSNPGPIEAVKLAHLIAPLQSPWVPVAPSSNPLLRWLLRLPPSPTNQDPPRVGFVNNPGQTDLGMTVPSTNIR